MNEKMPLLGLRLDELKEVARSLGMPAFTGAQMAKWIYGQRVRSIDEMTNISKANREKLAEKYVIGSMQPIDSQHSADGTIKYLFPVSTTNKGNVKGNLFVETVYIPDGNRATLCVSCQVGCKMNCLFLPDGQAGIRGEPDGCRHSEPGVFTT